MNDIFVEAGDAFKFFDAGIGLEAIGTVGDNDDVIYGVAFGGVDAVEADGIVLYLLPVEVQRNVEDGTGDGDADGIDVGWFEVEVNAALVGAVLEL